MTAPNGPILFNNSTGSDTQSSGLGPGPAVFGSGASTTGSSAVVTGIDTTGVTVGDLLWLQSSSGRQFSIIASVDSGSQVTCDDTFANTESSRTWAIGGKRSTWENASSRQIFLDARANWRVQTETDQTIGSAITLSASPEYLIEGSSASLPQKLIQTANTHCIASASGGQCNVKNIWFQNANGTKTSARAYQGAGANFPSFVNCIFGDAANGLRYGASTVGNFGKFINCRFFPNVTDGHHIGAQFGGGQLLISGCFFGYCLGDAVDYNSTTRVTLENSIFAGGDNRALRMSAGQLLMSGNVFYGFDGSAVVASSSLNYVNAIRNIFVSNGGWAIDFPSTQQTAATECNRNVFFSNTSGEINNIPNGTDDITLTADPFVDAASGDFNLNDTAGGGALLRSATFNLP